MNFYNISVALRNEAAKNAEVKHEQIVPRFDESNYTFDQMNIDTGEVKKAVLNTVNKEENPMSQKKRMEWVIARNTRIKEQFGIDLDTGSNWKDRDAAELATMATETLSLWQDMAADNALTEAMQNIVQDFTDALPDKLAFRACRSMFKQGMGQAIRTSIMHPKMSPQVDVMSAKFATLDDDQREKLDKMLESVNEMEAATRPLMFLADAARVAVLRAQWTNRQGEVMALEPKLALVEEMVKSEARSREARYKWQNGGLVEKGQQLPKLELDDAEMKALAISVFNKVPDWANELELMSDMDVAERQMESLSQAAFSHQATQSTTVSIAEQTGKHVATSVSGNKGVVEKELDQIQTNLARPEYQPKRGVFLDTEGNVIKPEGDIIAALPIAQPHQATGETLEDLAKQEFLTDLCMDIPFFIDARDEARASADPMVLIGFNKKLNAAAALYAADMDELDAALAMVTKAVNAVL